MNLYNQTGGKYSCTQLFGYKGKSEKLLEEDNLTTLKFDHTGRHLAVGDRAGRLIVFQTDSQLHHKQQYQYYFELQAQSPEFDTLKNHSVKEEVMHIDWFRPQGRYQKVLTANSHTVKLWKLYEKSDKRVTCWSGQEPTLCWNVKKSYKNASFSPLNCVQLSQNEEFIFTVDEKALYLWNVQKNSRPFQQREIAGEAESKLEQSEKITCANISKQRQSLQVLGTNLGKLSVVDSRTSFNNPVVLDFKCARDNKNFLSQIINQYSAVNFLEGKGKVVTRDLISVKIWDLRNSRQPLLNIYVDETIQRHVGDLFQAEVLSDKFKLTEVQGNIVTGNYGDSFEIINPLTGQNVQYQLDYGQKTRARKVGEGQRFNPFSCEAKVLGHDYNEVTGQLAVSSQNCFFIFSEKHNN